MYTLHTKLEGAIKYNCYSFYCSQQNCQANKMAGIITNYIYRDMVTAEQTEDKMAAFL